MTTVNHPSAVVDVKKARQHRWTWFDLKKKVIQRICYGTVNETHFHSWSKLSNQAKKEVRVQLESHHVDIEKFKSGAQDDLWELASIKTCAAFRILGAGAISGDTDSDSHASDNDVVSVETATVVTEDF